VLFRSLTFTAEVQIGIWKLLECYCNECVLDEKVGAEDD